MSDKITNLDQLRTTAVEARGLIGEVARAAADAIEGLEKDMATRKYVEDLVGSIATRLDVINGEVA